MTERNPGDAPVRASTRRRASQYLAVPIGGLAPAHRPAPLWLRVWRRQGTGVLTAVGCAAALLGVLVSLAPRPIPVYVSGNASELHIGGSALRRAPTSPVPGFVLFAGDAAVLASELDLRARTAGAASLGGRRASGSCAPAASATAVATDECRFQIGGTRLASRDVYDQAAHAWRRTYSDGRTVVFEVPGGQKPVPVPLPLGH